MVTSKEPALKSSPSIQNINILAINDDDVYQLCITVCAVYLPFTTLLFFFFLSLPLLTTFLSPWTCSSLTLVTDIMYLMHLMGRTLQH